MSELDLKLQSSRGMRAQELLRDDILLEALDAIEKECVEAWEQCPARDAEGKEMHWQLYKTAKKFRNTLLGYVETGKLASNQLQAYARKDGPIRRAFRSL